MTLVSPRPQLPCSRIETAVKTFVVYHLCPCCWRAVPAGSGERFCPNDGTPLLTACPRCQEPILSPYARFCVSCGLEFGMKESKVK